MKRIINTLTAALISLILIVSLAGCDGPWPRQQGGDDGRPLTGVMTGCYIGPGYSLYVIHADDSLWSHRVGSVESGSQLGATRKIMDGVKSVYWASGSFRILAHKLDGSLWLLQYSAAFAATRNTKLMDDVSFVSLGDYLTLAIKTDGSLWQLKSDSQSWNGGYPFLQDDKGNILPAEHVMDGVVYASAGAAHALAVCEDGSLWMWEYSDELASADDAANPGPVKVMDDIAYASAGSGYSMVIDKEGGLWAFGKSIPVPGRLGTGLAEDCDEPVKILDEVSYVSTSTHNTMAVKTDGSLWFFGGYDWQSPSANPGGITTGTLSPTKVWDDETFQTTYGLYGFSHNGAVKSDGGFWMFTRDAFNMKQMAEDVLFEYSGFCVMEDGSLWAVYDYWNDIPEPVQILPPGTVRTQ